MYIKVAVLQPLRPLLVVVAAVFSLARLGAVEIVCSPDLVQLTCTDNAVVNYESNATNYDGVVVCSPPSGSTFTLGATAVICTATNIAGQSATCSFQVTVKPTPQGWPCPPSELGLGIPFDLVGGARSVVRPGPGLGGPGIAIVPDPVNTDSGISLHPGGAQAITFTTLLDFNAPVGSGFDLVLPSSPGLPPGEPILSIRSKGAKGYCVKTMKAFADEPGTAMRALVVNSNGGVLPPIEFTRNDVDSAGVMDIQFRPGVSNCHVTIELNCIDGTVSVEIPGPVTQSSSRKGWDGCIYGPDRPVKKPTSRLISTPVTSSAGPPITNIMLRASGWPEMVIEEPSTTTMGRKWGDGHVTLMKAYDDGMESVILAPGGGVHVDTGPSTRFSMQFSRVDNPGTLPPQQGFRISGGRWPSGTITNGPPPPFALRLNPGSTGIGCAVDYSAFGTSNVTIELRLNGKVVKQFSGVQGQINTPSCTLSRSPIILGCPGVGVLRLADTTPFTVSFNDGSGGDCDDLRIIPELPPGAVLPESFSTIECLGGNGLDSQFAHLQITPATPQDPLSLSAPADMVTGATSSAGAAVNFSPVLHVGECAAFPFPTVVCRPPTGSTFPVGVTTVDCSVSNACGETSSASFHVTVDQRPAIVSQPSSITVPVGASAKLAAQAFGLAPTVYRWEIFCPPTRPDYPFCGCLAQQTWRPLCLGCPPPFVDFPSVTADCGAGYYLVLSNDFGVVFSEVAYLTIVPRIVCPPDLVVVTCSNSAVANFRPEALGAQGTVQCAPPSGSLFNVGTTPVTCTASNYSGGTATCGFNVIVKPAPSRWACGQVGIGLPYSSVGGATAFVRPDTGDGDPAIVLVPAQGVPRSGLLLSPGPADAVTFTTLLDFTAPVGSGFDIFAPPDPLHPNDPPILSIRSKGAKGYCVKSNKRFADDGAAMRAYVVNTNGDLLDSLTFTPAEVEANGICDIGFRPGVSNVHVTVQLGLRDGTVSVEFAGPVTQSAARKGWDGCIYGPDRPIKKGTARVILAPPVNPGLPPLTDLFVYASGVTEMPLESPQILSAGRKWGDGHVTLMKAYDDGEQGVEFRSFAPGGGVHVDLGPASSLDLRLKQYFETGDIPTEQQLVTRTIGPIRGLTNRPPPPFLDELKLQGSTGAVVCSADFNNLGSATVSVFLYSNHVMVAQRVGVPAVLDSVLFTLPDWPESLGKIGGATPCRRGTIKGGIVRLAGGSGFNLNPSNGEELVGADEFRVLAELPANAPHPDYYSGFDFIASEGATWRVSTVTRTLACTPGPITFGASAAGLTLSWSGEGFRLQGAHEPAGPWFDLGTASPVTLDGTHAARFFRLKCD